MMTDIFIYEILLYSLSLQKQFGRSFGYCQAIHLCSESYKLAWCHGSCFTLEFPQNSAIDLRELGKGRIKIAGVQLMQNGTEVL